MACIMESLESLQSLESWETHKYRMLIAHGSINFIQLKGELKLSEAILFHGNRFLPWFPP